MPENFIDQTGSTPGIQGGAMDSPGGSNIASLNPPTPANTCLQIMHGIGDQALNIPGDSILIGSI